MSDSPCLPAPRPWPRSATTGPRPGGDAQPAEVQVRRRLARLRALFQAFQLLLEQHGRRFVYLGRSAEVLVGDQSWDAVALVEYPSRAVFLRVIGLPEYAAMAQWRDGLERLDGDHPCCWPPLTARGPPVCRAHERCAPAGPHAAGAGRGHLLHQPGTSGCISSRRSTASRACAACWACSRAWSPARRTATGAWRAGRPRRCCTWAPAWAAAWPTCTTRAKPARAWSTWSASMRWGIWRWTHRSPPTSRAWHDRCRAGCAPRVPPPSGAGRAMPSSPPSIRRARWPRWCCRRLRLGRGRRSAGCAARTRSHPARATVPADRVEAAARLLRNGQPTLLLGDAACFEAPLRQAGRLRARSGCALMSEFMCRAPATRSAGACSSAACPTRSTRRWPRWRPSGRSCWWARASRCPSSHTRSKPGRRAPAGCHLLTLAEPGEGRRQRARRAGGRARRHRAGAGRHRNEPRALDARAARGRITPDGVAAVLTALLPGTRW